MYLLKVIMRSVGGNRFFILFLYTLLLEASFATWKTDFINLFYAKTIAQLLYFPWLGTGATEEVVCTLCRLWLVAECIFCSKSLPFLQV